MSTAFQPNAFQLDAFQVAGGVTGDVDYTLDIDPGSYLVTGYSVDLFYPGSFAGGRNYIIKGRKYYNLTNEELAYLISRELIDYTREDIKVTYKNKKPHRIPKTAWDSLQETLKRLETLDPIEDDDEEAILLLL